MQTISSTARSATIASLNKRWIDDPRKRVKVESHIPLKRAAEAGIFAFLVSDDVATALDPNTNGAGPFQCLIHLNPAGRRAEAREALPVTNEVLRRFNRETDRLAAGILGAMVSATLVLAALIQDGQPKAVDQADEERQTSGNALVKANPSTLSKAVGWYAESTTGKIASEQATSVDYGFTSPRETPFPRMEPAVLTQTPVLAFTPATNQPDLAGESLVSDLRHIGYDGATGAGNPVTPEGAAEASAAVRVLRTSFQLSHGRGRH